MEGGQGGVVVGDTGSPGGVAPSGGGAQHGGRVSQGCSVIGQGGGMVSQGGGMVCQGGCQHASGSHGDQGGEDNLEIRTSTNLAVAKINMTEIKQKSVFLILDEQHIDFRIIELK